MLHMYYIYSTQIKTGLTRVSNARWLVPLSAITSIDRINGNTGEAEFLRATAGTAIARLSHRNSVGLSVRHTGGSGKNGAS